MNIYYLKRMRRKYEYFHTPKGWWVKMKKGAYSAGPLSTVMAMDVMLHEIAGFFAMIDWWGRVSRRARLVKYRNASKLKTP